MKRLALLVFAAGLMTSTAALADHGARSGDRNEIEQRLRDKAEGKWTYKGHRADKIHGPEFVAPPRWARRSYGQGDFIPGAFLTEAYFVDAAALGLEPAGAGRHWVRVGPDVYLVAGRGKVLDVVPGVYY
jgi:Ni/Co efflux regulator RcnB